MNNIYNADAYEKIDHLIKYGIRVDHIITDPPYNISQENNFNTMNNPRSGIDFGEWDRGKFDLFSWIPKYLKILNKDGSIVIFCSYRYISYIIDVLENNGVIVKDVLVWQKSNPMPRNIARRYVQDMEFAIWGVKKGAKWVFNKSKEKSYERSLFFAPLVAGKERLGHPTQKSLKIMKEIIEIHTNKDQTILDPFMGSGTTGQAALELGRQFIGIEKEKDFFEICKKRLDV